MGILGSLYDPAAAAREAAQSGQPPVQQTLTPTDQDMATITQTAPDPDVDRAQARSVLESDLPVAASAAAVVAALADQSSMDAVTDDGDAAHGFVRVESEGASHDALLTQSLLKRMNWRDLESDDPDQRSKAMAANFYLRRVVSTGVARGNEAELARVWQAYAGSDAPSFEDMVRRRRSKPLPPVPSIVIAPKVEAKPTPDSARATSDLAVRPPSSFEPTPSPVFPKRPDPPAAAKNSPVSPAQAPARPTPQGGGGGGVGFSDLVKMPFVMAGSAGSMVLAGLGKAGQAAQGAYVRSRVNGHEVLGTQVNAHAQAVVNLSEKLRSQGMGELVEFIRRTGAPPAEVFAGMHEGGKYDVLGKKYDRLMKQQEVAKTFGDLQSHMTKFDHAARRYARTGADLNLDFDTPVRSGTEAMMKATEGLPIKEGGAFKHLQDRLQEMTARIVEMIERLFSKLMPGRA
ncbi:MAG: hypothetical protein ACREPQ_00965 [Rhodanobacter sp.]